MKTSLGRSVLLMMLVALPILAGCEREITGAKARAILSWAEPEIESLFAGLLEDDYAVFSRDFGTYMQESIPASCFEEWKHGLQSRLGDYISREVHRVSQSDEYYVVEYRSSFELADSVMVGVAFGGSEPHAISHLWIETDNLHAAPEPRRQCELQDLEPKASQ